MLMIDHMPYAFSFNSHMPPTPIPGSSRARRAFGRAPVPCDQLSRAVQKTKGLRTVGNIPLFLVGFWCIQDPLRDDIHRAIGDEFELH